MLSAKYRQLVVVILKISKYGPTSHFLTATAPTPQSEPASSSSSVISSLLTPVSPDWTISISSGPPFTVGGPSPALLITVTYITTFYSD